MQVKVSFIRVKFKANTPNNAKDIHSAFYSAFNKHFC